jgi:hypothetical protein
MAFREKMKKLLFYCPFAVQTPDTNLLFASLASSPSFLLSCVIRNASSGSVTMLNSERKKYSFERRIYHFSRGFILQVTAMAHERTDGHCSHATLTKMRADTGP